MKPKESKKVKGTPYKRNVYYLTDKGETKAKEIKRDIEEKNIHVRTESGVTKIKLKDIENFVHGPNSYLFALNNLDKNNLLDLTEMGQEDLFIDRKKEKEFLKEHIKKKRDRSFKTLLIKGYAGVGKTRLVKEIERYVKGLDIDFYHGRGDHESVQPFFPFQNIFVEILGERPEIIEDEDILKIFKNEDGKLEDDFEDLDISERNFFNEMKNFLERSSSERPIIIFIDNLQWNDDVSLRFLDYLTEELEKNTLYLIAAYRDEEMDHPISNESEILELEPFDWKNTRKFIAKKIGRYDIPGDFVDLIYNLTDGIPLFIKTTTDEMLKEGILKPLKEIYPETRDEVKLPHKVKELYEFKSRKLNQKEKELLQLCCCIDDDFSEELITKTFDEKEDEVRDMIKGLKRAKLLGETSKNRLDFTHEMTRFTLYKTLSKSKRKDLHAKLVESLRGMDEQKGVNYHLNLGRQLEKSEKFDEAVRSFLKGGDEAEEIYEHEKAVELYEKALKVLEEHPTEGMDKSKVHECLADVLKRKEDYRKAIDHLKKAEKETEKKRNLVRLSKKIAGAFVKTSQYDKASEYIEKGEKLLSDIEDLSFEDKKEKCKLLKEKGMVCLRKNEFDECENFFRQMKKLSEEIDSKEDRAEAIHYLGSIAYYRSDFDQAKEFLQRSIEIRKQTNDLKGLAKSYNNLGVVFRNLQKPHKALKFYKKVNEIEKETGSEHGLPSALDNIGIIYYDLGELDKAIEYHQKCLEIEKKMEDEHGMAATLDNIGVNYFAKGEFDKALEYHERSLELKKKLEERSGISFSLYNMALSLWGKSEFEKSLEFLEESLEIRRDLEDRLNMGYSKLWKGIVYLDMREFDKSNECLKTALDIFKETKSDHGIGMTLAYLGKLKVLQDSLEEAERYLKHSEKIKSKLEEEGYKLIVDRHLSEFYLEKNRLERSLAHCQKSLNRAKRSDMTNQLGKCRKVLGKIYCEKRVFEKGQREFIEALNIFEETGDKKSKAEVLFEWGKRLKEQGAEDKGEEKISEALRTFEECNIDTSTS